MSTRPLMTKHESRLYIRHDLAYIAIWAAACIAMPPVVESPNPWIGFYALALFCASYRLGTWNGRIITRIQAEKEVVEE